MGLFKVTRESETEIDTENMGVIILHSPTFIEEPKDLFKREWANEDGIDVYLPINRKTKAQTIDIDIFCQGDNYLIDYKNFCIFIASKKFTWKDLNQEISFNAIYESQSVKSRDDVNKQIIGTITILNNTGRFSDIITDVAYVGFNEGEYNILNEFDTSKINAGIITLSNESITQTSVAFNEGIYESSNGFNDNEINGNLITSK